MITRNRRMIDSRATHRQGHRLSKRSLRLTAEGWYYVLVIAFIIGGAVLREVNLLVLLAGLMLGPVSWNWLIAKRALRNLAATRLGTNRTHVGKPLSVKWQIHNHDRRLPSWGIALEESLSRKSESRGVWMRTVAPCVAPQQATQAGYELKFKERGEYFFGPVRFSTSFPLGLVRSRASISDRFRVLVWPQIGQMTSAWKRLLQRSHAGYETSRPQRGQLEGDYYGLREWRAGDSRRWIHWRTSARVNNLTVKQFEQRRDESLSLVIDLWAPPENPQAVQAHVERLLRFAATVIEDRRRLARHEVQISIQGAQHNTWRGLMKDRLAAQIQDEFAVAQAAAWDETRPLDTLWQDLDGRNRVIIVLSTRLQPAAAASSLQYGDLLWISPSEFSEWFEDVPSEQTKTVLTSTPDANVQEVAT